jgi:hypothetical protein
MSLGRIITALLVLFTLTGTGVQRGGAQMAAPTPPPDSAQPSPSSEDTTPPRLSYINGEVSFWRPGADDWAPARVNTPLAPGDVLYTAEGGNVEIQVGPRAFVRAAEETQIGLDNQELNFTQFRMTAGQAGLDLRQLPPGSIVELDTPNAAFTIEGSGYYRVNVEQDSTAFSAYRGGSATMTAAGGAATPIGPNQRIVLEGAESPRVELGGVPDLTPWDRWNYQRTNYLTQAGTTRYTSPAVYGTEALEEHGQWKTVETYGAVWVPTAVPAGWVPYSTGRWIWDARFGWTWLDDAPWGWAPYHYGRWVFVGNYWAWAPGPIVVRPAYAPALVVFLGGATVSIGRPVCWAPLGWGEPIIPWWGRAGFVGRPWWGGWGGPHIVNNVVINRTTTVNVTEIKVYKHVSVTGAVVGVPSDRFGHGHVQVTRISQAEARQLTPVRGALDAKPVAASLMPATGQAVKPPPAVHGRAVVATRPPQDPTASLREHGLGKGPALAPAPAPRIVAPPPRASIPPRAPVPEGREGRGAGKVPETPGGRAGRVPERPEQQQPRREGRVTPRVSPGPPDPGNQQQPAAPTPENRRGNAVGRPAPPPPPPPKVTAPQHGQTKDPAVSARPEPRANQPAPAPRPPQQHSPRPEPSGRPEQQERGEAPQHGERQERR